MKRFPSKSLLRLSTLCLTTLLLMFSACSKSEEYVYVDDTIVDNGKVPVTATDANGNESGLSVGSTMGIYVTDGDGNVTLLQAEVGADGTIVLPASAQGMRMVAYLPYQEHWDNNALYMPQVFQVASEQTTEASYEASDLMIGGYDGVTRSVGGMLFVHQMAQVMIHIVDETGVNDYENCGVTLRNVKNAVSVNLSEQSVATISSSVGDIKMLPFVVSDHRLSLKAIVAPQQIEAGTKFITFINNGYGRRYSIPQLADIQGGKTYTFSMRLTQDGLEFSGSSVNDWDEEGEVSLEIR